MRRRRGWVPVACALAAGLLVAGSVGWAGAAGEDASRLPVAPLPVGSIEARLAEELADALAAYARTHPTGPWFHVSRPVTAARETDLVRLILPGSALTWSDGTSLELGDLILLIRAPEAPVYHFRMTLPAAVRIVDSTGQPIGELAVSGGEVSGRWRAGRMELEALVARVAGLRIRLGLSDGSSLALEEGSAALQLEQLATRDGVWSGAVELAWGKFDAVSPIGETVAFGRLQFRAEGREVERRAWQHLLASEREAKRAGGGEGTEAEPSVAPPARPDPPPPWLAEASWGEITVDLMLEDLVAGGRPGGEGPPAPFAAAQVALQGRLDARSEPGELALFAEVKGLAPQPGLPPALAPREGRVRIRVASLPLRALLGGAARAADGMPTDLLLAAGTRVRLDELAVATATSRLAAAGSLAPAPAGARVPIEAAIEMEAAGLEAVLQALLTGLPNEPRAAQAVLLVLVLQGLGQVGEAGDGGEPRYRLAIEVAADGRVRINEATFLDLAELTRLQRNADLQRQTP